MTDIGQIERNSQDRIVQLFKDRLDYDYLGDWQDREDNINVEEEYLRPFLKRQGYHQTKIDKAVYELTKAAGVQTEDLYDSNKAVYRMLRYGVSVRAAVGQNSETVHFIDWTNTENNHFAIAEEVSVKGVNNKRPDLVLYINGIAVGVIELKRSKVSVEEGIRQNLDNQTDNFIKPFFNTMQLVMAGNETAGLRYGTPKPKRIPRMQMSHLHSGHIFQQPVFYVDGTGVFAVCMSKTGIHLKYVEYYQQFNYFC